MKKTLFVVLGLMIFISCGKKVQSSFIADKTEISAGESVQFTNTAVDAAFYHWKFGDGTESREANPLHIFTKSGDMNVMLHVSNKGGDRWDNYSQTIRVNGFNLNFVGQWGVSESYTTQHCGNNNRYYNMNITKGNNLDEVEIYNLGNSFDVIIKGKSPYGDPNKIQIDEQGIIAKNEKTYNVNGNITLSGLAITINYSIFPTDTTSVCGTETGNGTGVKL